MTIVILPLDQIENEQSEYIRQIGGIPCFLNRDTISPKLLKEVQQRRFTHILISPELAIGDDFWSVASSPSTISGLVTRLKVGYRFVSQRGRGCFLTCQGT
jgi:hypothetical protein